jgi:hypothetical protein
LVENARLSLEDVGLSPEKPALPYGGSDDSDSQNDDGLIGPLGSLARLWHGWLALLVGLAFGCWGSLFALKGLYLLDSDWRSGLWYCLLAAVMVAVFIRMEYYSLSVIEGGLPVRKRSPLTEWREKSGLSITELADLCDVTEAKIIRIEAGEERLIGEVQDCLTARGENVSAMASAHSESLAFVPARVQFIAPWA